MEKKKFIFDENLTPENKEKYEISSPYLEEKFKEESDEYKIEEIETRFSQFSHHYVLETTSGKKYVEKYLEENKSRVEESENFINEFFESELFKTALNKRILDKEEIVIPSIKLSPEKNKTYYSEFIPDIYDPMNPNYNILINKHPFKEPHIEKFKKVDKEIDEKYNIFLDLMLKEKNAIPMAILHLIAGDKDRVMANYKLQHIQKKGKIKEKYRLVVLDMAGGDKRCIGSAVGYNLFKKVSEEKAFEYLPKIKDFARPELIEEIIDKLPSPRELKDKKRREILDNIKNIELLLAEEFKFLRECETAKKI